MTRQPLPIPSAVISTEVSAYFLFNYTLLSACESLKVNNPKQRSKLEVILLVLTQVSIAALRKNNWQRLLVVQRD